MNVIRLRITNSALFFGRLTNRTIARLRCKPELGSCDSESLDLAGFNPHPFLVGILREEDFLPPEGFDLTASESKAFACAWLDVGIFFCPSGRFEADMLSTRFFLSKNVFSGFNQFYAS